MASPPEAPIQDDFARIPVPPGRRVGGFHIAMVVIGGTISIPGFLMAAAIGGGLGVAHAAAAFVLGCFTLAVLGAMTAWAGVKSRFSAYMLAEFAFGRRGAAVANLAVALSLVGWFGVISNIFAQAADGLARQTIGLTLPVEIYVVTGSLLIVGVTISGFKGIDKLALALVPLMALFLIYAAVLSAGKIDSWVLPADQHALSFSSAVSAVIGSYIAGVIIQPDYARFARNRPHAIWSAFLALGVSFPIVLFLAAIPSVATGQSDLFLVMLGLGIGVPAFLLLLLASWSSNVLCLYSSGLSLATIVKRVNLRTILLIVGTAGTALAFLHAQDYLTRYLILLGIALPPVASIYASEALLFRDSFSLDALEKEPTLNWTAFAAWIGAVAAGYAANAEWMTLTGVAALDSILVAFIIYAGLGYARRGTARRAKRAV